MRKSCYCAVSREVLRLPYSGFEPKKICCSFYFLCTQFLDDIVNLRGIGSACWGVRQPGKVKRRLFNDQKYFGVSPRLHISGAAGCPRSIWKQSAQGILFKDNFWRSVLDTKKLMGNFKIMNEWILKNSAIFWPYLPDFIQVPIWKETIYHRI